MTKSIIRVAIITLCLLAIPFVGTLTVDGWNWGPGDFAVIGAIIFVIGMLIEIAKKRAPNKAYFAAATVALLATFFLFWVNGAVGIIGEDDWPNLLYLATILLEIIGAFIAGLKAREMSRSMSAVAIATFAIPLLVLKFDPALLTTPPPGTFGVFVLNTFFVVAFALSAFLFKKASDITPELK